MFGIFRRRELPAAHAWVGPRDSRRDSAVEPPDAWERHVARLRAQGVPEPGSVHHKPGTTAEERSLYDANPSFVGLLPWAEYLPDTQCMLLDDGESVAAFFEVIPIGTEGREAGWLEQVRDAVENALQDSFSELEGSPWVIQLYAQDETGWDDYMRKLRDYVHPRAKGTAFTEFYLRFFEHHLQAISKPGGLFEDETVTQLPWRADGDLSTHDSDHPHATRSNSRAGP